MLQDAHLHLQDVEPGSDLGYILSHAREHGVGRFFCNASAPSDWGAVRAIADGRDDVVPFFGVHPWYADEAIPDWDEKLLAYLGTARSKVGEIGLDRAKRGADFELQKKIFGRQLEIVRRLRRPFVVHCVDAWGPLIEMLHGSETKGIPFIVHWFSGSRDIAAELIKLGGYISFSSRLADEGAEKTISAFKDVPVGRILLETDFPYMAGVPKDEAPTVEMYFQSLSALYSCAARLKGMEEPEFAETVWENGTAFAA
jgi:TatD DNase family protein